MLLFWLLDVAKADVGISADDEKQMSRWLKTCYSDRGFEAYCRHRILRIRRELAGGVGMLEKRHDDYVRMIGQKFEILRFADLARKAHEKAQRDAAKKKK